MVTKRFSTPLLSNKLSFEQQLLQESGLFHAKPELKDDKMIKKQDDSFNKNVRYSTSTDFNIFSAQLNKTRKGFKLEVSHEKPKPLTRAMARLL